MGRLDVHHHIVPADSVSALARRRITGGGGMPFAAREKIERANARSLLPRLAARLGAAS